MKILVLGGTGSIGSGIVATLSQRGHEVTGLARSRHSADKLKRSGATPVLGDMKNPDPWLNVVENVDAVVQAAATWDDDMEAVDRRLIESLLNAMTGFKQPKALIYTGGCWLYGNTADVVATESSPYDLRGQFSASIQTIDRLLSATGIRGMVIHPAMVYETNGAYFRISTRTPINWVTFA